MHKLFAISTLLLLAIICGCSKNKPESAEPNKPATTEILQTDISNPNYAAELDLQPRGIDGGEPVEYTFNQRFSFVNAIEGLNGIRDILNSFVRLTEASRNIIPKERMNKIGNNSGETQMLRFRNLPNAIEGALRKQEYVIKKLSYELAQYQLKSREINQDKFEEIEKEYQQEETSFQEFWNEFQIAD
jgi:hypothetical protein